MQNRKSAKPPAPGNSSAAGKVAIPIKEPKLELSIHNIPAEKLLPAPYNPRTISSEMMEDLRRSIKMFGIVEPLVVNSDMTIIAGHQRFKAATELDYKSLPCVVVSLSKIKEKMLNIGLNKIDGEWTRDALARAIRDIIEADEPDFEFPDIGFNEKEVERLLTDIIEETTPKKEAQELTPPKKSRIKKGEIWLLGNHRILCGDSTDPGDVEKLIGDEKADLCLTDPPYCVDYENLERRKDAPTRKQMGDSYKDPGDPAKLLKFIDSVPCDILVMTFPINKHFHQLSEATREWDLLYDCVWVKHHFAFAMGRRYQSRHEPILIFRKRNYKRAGVWNIPANQSTVFEFDKAATNPEHPTIKPLDLWSQLLRFHSKRGQTIYEPFSGSGTTLIASQLTGRKCLAIDIDPGYCEVTIARWERLTGGRAVILK